MVKPSTKIVPFMQLTWSRQAMHLRLTTYVPPACAFRCYTTVLTAAIFGSMLLSSLALPLAYAHYKSIAFALQPAALQPYSILYGIYSVCIVFIKDIRMFVHI